MKRRHARLVFTRRRRRRRQSWWWVDVSIVFFPRLWLLYAQRFMLQVRERRLSCTPYRRPAWRTPSPGPALPENWMTADAIGRYAERRRRDSNGPAARTTSTLAPASRARSSTPANIVSQSAKPKPTPRSSSSSRCKSGAPSWTSTTTRPDER